MEVNISYNEAKIKSLFKIIKQIQDELKEIEDTYRHEDRPIVINNAKKLYVQIYLNLKYRKIRKIKDYINIGLIKEISAYEEHDADFNKNIFHMRKDLSYSKELNYKKIDYDGGLSKKNIFEFEQLLEELTFLEKSYILKIILSMVYGISESLTENIVKLDTFVEMVDIELEIDKSLNDIGFLILNEFTARKLKSNYIRTDVKYMISNDLEDGTIILLQKNSFLYKELIYSEDDEIIYSLSDEFGDRFISFSTILDIQLRRTKFIGKCCDLDMLDFDDYLEILRTPDNWETDFKDYDLPIILIKSNK